MQQQDKNSMLQKELELISLLLTPSGYLKATTCSETAKLFLLLADSYIKRTDGETFYRLPYKEISEKIYKEMNDTIRSNELTSFAETVSEKINEMYPKLEAENIKNEFKYELNSLEHIHECFNKFIQHIALAQVQKTFIQQSAADAKNLASIAKDQAEKAKKMSDGMVTHFVTILGVFATIIITVFGGINIIGSTVKLLEGNNRLVYLVFVVSFLMICLLTLIKILTSWISSIGKENDSKNTNSDNFFCSLWKKTDFYTKSIVSFIIVLAVSIACITRTHKNEDNKSKENDSKSSNQNSVFIINTEKPEIQETKEPQKNIVPTKP